MRKPRNSEATTVARFKENVARLAALIVGDNLIVRGTPGLTEGDAARVANAVTLALMVVDETEKQIDRQLEQTLYQVDRRAERELDTVGK